MQVRRKGHVYSLPDGCFSRTYIGQDNVLRSVAYHTPSQSVAMLEGDSANVWQRVFDDRGYTERALAYIVANGRFEGDPDIGAQEVLNVFLLSLCDAGLLMDSRRDERDQPVQTWPASTIRAAANGPENVETQIAQFMSDNHIFYSLVLELTYRCNERCVHCYCPDNRQTAELTATQIAALLDEFQEMGGMSLQITGGEIFARKDIKLILRDLQHRNIVVSVISNLTLADEEGLDLLSSLNPRSVGCSIYSADPTTHDDVTQTPGSWKRSVAAIRFLRNRGVPVIVKAPLMKNTIGGWRELETLADKMGCGLQLDVNITPKNDGRQSPTDLRVNDRVLLKDLFSSRFYRVFKSNEPMAIAPEEQRQEAVLCGAGATGLAVSPDGKVRACIGMLEELGHWPHQSLSHVWEHSPFFIRWTNQRLMDIEKCSSCQHFSFCNRCPGSWQLETGSVTRPADYTCFLAQVWADCSKVSAQS